MFNIVSLFFTQDFQSESEPVYLLLGAGIGIIAIAFFIKKILNGRNNS